MTQAELIVALGRAGVEIFLFLFACAIMLADLFLPRRWRKIMHALTVGALAAAAVAALVATANPPSDSFNGFYVETPLTSAFKGIALLTAAGSLLFMRAALIGRRMQNGDFYALALFSVLGMMVLISAGHFLTLYLGLELMSLCLYAIIAMRRGSADSSESAIKYFVLGALASGLFLFGVSLIYGASGELNIDYVATSVSAYNPQSGQWLVLVLGLVFVMAGMGFKMGLAPFHMWLPDVYHSASAPVTLFIAAAPKVAATALMMRVLTGALPTLFVHWQQMLIVMAVASLIIGNITAIAQTNLKRMLAYSAIAHSGFIALGILSGVSIGGGAVLFYIAAYALMTIGGFGVIVLLAKRQSERAQLDDMKGMAARNPVVAATVAVLMLSLAGIPPTVGFVAKFAILESVVESGLLWLAVFAVIMSLIGAFYYLRVIRLMYFEDAPAAAKINLHPRMTLLLLAIATLIVLGGITPGPLLSFLDSTITHS